MPEGFRAYGAGGETALHPVIACALVLAAIFIFALPRRHVIPALFATFFLLPMDQVIVLGPFHFNSLRVVLLIGWIRLLGMKVSSHDKLLSGGTNAIDKAIVCMGLFGAANFLLLWREWGALINQLGEVYTLFGVYFLLRFLIRDEEDVRRTIRALAFIAAVVAVIMVIEQATGRNPYAFAGGARQDHREALSERGDRFRAMGPFGNAILAGTFGATSLPLFFGLWWRSRENRGIALIGMIAATVMTITSNSSTPVMAYGASVGALCLWPLRKHMRTIRWGTVVSLTALHLVMKAPVWALIGRMDFMGGSAWHRYEMWDNFIRRFGDWWLLGVKNTADWGWDMWDHASQFVMVGEVHGLLPLISFIAVLVFGFKYLGMARKASEGKKSQELFFWALGAGLFSHVVAFFGIPYFDQTMVAWYALLAMISVASAPSRKVAARRGKPGVVHLADSPWEYATPSTTISTGSGL